MKDPDTDVSYAICMDDACGKLTCTTCKALLDSVEDHTCDQNEDYKKFKEAAAEKGFKDCPTCASTVELKEACNHIQYVQAPSSPAQKLTTCRCQCGAEFCYICGESWPGMHGCPHYGPAIYDEEGYNQDGFHCDTGLDREGHTRRQVVGDADSDDDDETENDDPDARHFVLQHVDAAMRATFNALPHQDREAFLLNLQIQLFEERGITFNLPGEDRSDDEGSEDDDDDEDGNESENINDLDADNRPGDLDARDEDNGSNSATNIDTDNVDQNTAGQNDGAAASRNVGILNMIDSVPTNLEEYFEEVVQGLDVFRNGASSSATSPATDRPATPMDVDSAEQGTKQESEPSLGTPGSWPDDEEL